MNVIATGTLSKEDGALFVDLEFHPASELEHEIIAEFIREQQRVVLTPTKLVFNQETKAMDVTPTRELEGEVLKVRLAVGDSGAFDAAVHNLENRKRAADGRPSIEEEAAASARAEEAQEEAVKSGITAAQQVEAERIASRDRIEALAAKEIADRALATAPPPLAGPLTVSEGTKAEPVKSESKDPGTVQ